MRKFSYGKTFIAAAAAVIFVSFSALALFIVASDHRKLVDEISEKNVKIDELYSIVSEYGSDINELRKKLLLPEKVYFSDSGDAAESDSVTSEGTEPNEDLPFYLAADRLIAFNTKLMNMKLLTEYVNSVDFKNIINKYGLSVSKYGENGYKLTKNGKIYYVIELTRNKPVEYRISTGDSAENTALPSDGGFVSAAGAFISSNFDSIDSFFKKIDSLAERFRTLKTDSGLHKIINQYNLRYTLTDNSNQLRGTVETTDGRTLADFSLDKETGEIVLGETEFTDFGLFYNSLIELLESSDKRTENEIAIDSAKEKIARIAEDPVFQKYLKDRNLVLKTTVREDNDYYYFDFTDENGVKQGALGVQKHIGEIYLFDKEDIVISSLKTIAITSGGNGRPKEDFTIPENIGDIDYRYNNSMNILLIGSHERNADTIILANFNEKENKIRLISIPRDLYYKNRKINDYYRTGGGKVFTKIISDITGVSIDGYIGVDMYAFIDIINILGGIDVELKHDLTDPTYKIRDNGVWKTLHYSKGLHHLNGIEALRIARSRHTSSDFGRSDRQQLILKGLKDKLNDLNLTDMNKLYSIFKTATEYLDTDMSSLELVSIFLKYRDADIEKKDGLSVFNVLYNTYSNIYMLKDKSRQYDKDFNRGAWILLPKNNDWTVIKWYINKLINE